MKNVLVTALLADLLEREASVRLRVTGRSMHPCLIDDDLVTLEPVSPRQIRLGDLVYASPAGQPPLLHRVVGLKRGPDGVLNVETKGDALVMRDPAVPAAAVLGRAACIRRNLPAGRHRDVCLNGRRRRVLQGFLALGSRHAPRTFSAIARRLVPALDRVAARIPCPPG